MKRSCACRKKCFALQVKGIMRLVANWPDRIEWDLAKDNIPGIFFPHQLLSFVSFFRSLGGYHNKRMAHYSLVLYPPCFLSAAFAGA